MIVVFILFWQHAGNKLLFSNLRNEGDDIIKANNIIRRKFEQYRKNKFLLFLLFPGLLAMIIFQYIPMGGIIIAFKDYNFSDGVLKSPWIGFEHFRVLFSRPDAWNAIKNSFIISIYGFILGFPATIIFALLLNVVQECQD